MAFLFVDLEFSFLPLKYFIYFKRTSFCSGIVAKAYAGEKAHFLSLIHFFSPFAEFLCLKYMHRVKSFTDYGLIIVAEIYIVFRSELIRQVNSGPYSLGTNGSNDKSGIKKLKPVLIRLFDDNKVKSQLLDMGACKEGTAEVLFNNIDSILRKNKVDWNSIMRKRIPS